MKNRSYLQRFDNVELAVRQQGSGIPIIWGHGLLGSISVEDQSGIWDWDELEKHAHFVRYDARGHGNSDGSYDPEDYRWSYMAHDMLAIADSVAEQRGEDRYVLGGLSMGCATALEAAVQQPDKIAGLVLVLPPTAWETRSRQARIYRRMAWVSSLFGAAPYRLLDWLPKAIGDDERSRLVLATLRGLAQANPLHVQAALRGAALSDLPDMAMLKQLDIPAIIITWRDDAVHPVSTATSLAELLPDVRSSVITAPEEFKRWTPKVCQFLDELAVPKKRRTAPKKRRRTAA